MKIVLVAAIGANNVIGCDGRMPWRLKSDLQQFRAVTMGKPVVMGRKTYDSIGKPLKDRTSIVVTRNASLKIPGCVMATTIDDALGHAREDARRRGADELMVIGGGDLFAALMSRAARLEISHVHAAPAGDVFFPVIDPNLWREAARKDYPAGPQDSAAFSAVTYVRC